MPQNANIILIRHAEKPTKGALLSVAGQERAWAYTVFFQNYALDAGSPPVKIDYLFSSADSAASQRPRLTITPLSQALGLTISHDYPDKQYKEFAATINGNPAYNNSTLLICWHHGEILKLASALGAKASQMPKEANWPAKWPGDVFGWVLLLRYDAEAKLRHKHTFCLPQRLMYDDYGQDPPGGNS
ncbi:MAG TPA: hypothetical protein VFX96_06850 [Pyrinomonadaceae bacterium]|nr:hypothetical protein [Pyrinomonadaceae bacterium]